jgi:transcriptional antiterminator NusG
MKEDIRDPGEDWPNHQKIEIIDGPWVGFTGVIYSIDVEKKKVVVKINFWGRDTPVELTFNQIRPAN